MGFYNVFGPIQESTVAAINDNATINDENTTIPTLDSTAAEDVVTEDDYWREISSLSDGQEITLSLLQVTSGTLSLVGSAIIIYQVWYSQRHQQSSYGRILLALSLADLVASSSFVLAPFLLPAETSQRIWASGTNTSCNFLGFWTQLAYLAPWYNGMLGLYYYLTIRWSIPRAVFAKKYEKWIHILSWGFFIFSATPGSVIGIYSESELGQGCWVGKSPIVIYFFDSCLFS